MKKTTCLTIVILTLVLTACSASGANPASGPQAGPGAGALPAATQLLIGTLKLEGTAQVVTAEQAAELLPLWQTMKTLANSDTVADQEKEALVTQIQETMTAEQRQAITDMNLTRTDMASLMQEQGGMAMGDTTGNQNSSSGNSSRNNSGGGFGPGAGGPPPDEMMRNGGPGGGFGGGQNMSADQIATAQAARQANENSVPPMLINVVIEYLQKKAGL